MNGTDGKPFKTRDGGVLRLEDLIEMGVRKLFNALKKLMSVIISQKKSAKTSR